MIRKYRKRNPKLGLTELWCRLKKKGYTRRPESLYRVMRKLGMIEGPKPKQKRKSKLYEQMTHPGECVQIDVKVIPLKCLANPEERLYQYTAIDEYTRLRYLGAYSEQSTYSSADFLERVYKWFKRQDVTVECVQTDNGFEFTNKFSNSKRDQQTRFELTAKKLGIRHKLIRPYTPRHNARSREVTERIKSDFMIHTVFILSPILVRSSLRTKEDPIIVLCGHCIFSPAEFFFNVQYH